MMQNDPIGPAAEGLPTRRSFLTGLATATLAASSAGAVMAVQAAGAPLAPETSEQRAARAWSAFCDAMREVAAGADGWTIEGAGEQWTTLHPHQTPGPYLRVASLHYEARDFGGRTHMAQRRQEIAL